MTRLIGLLREEKRRILKSPNIRNEIKKRKKKNQIISKTEDIIMITIR